MRDFSQLQSEIAVSFKHVDILRQALTHRSYLNEHPEFELGHNERLEFLGDAVLELVVTNYLYTNHPDATEGDMTNWRASLVFFPLVRWPSCPTTMNFSIGRASRAGSPILASWQVLSAW